MAAGGSFEDLGVGVKLGLLAMLLLFLAAGYYFAFHMALSDEIEQARGEYVRLLQQQREAEQRQEEFLRLSQELAAREPIDRQNKRILPERAEIPAFVQDVNRLAELSGLDIDRIEPRPEEAQELYVRIPVSLVLKGRFHQVAKFFYTVSQLDRAINMENVKLANPEMHGEEIQLSIDVLATTFRRPTEEEVQMVAPAAAPAAAPGPAPIAGRH